MTTTSLRRRTRKARSGRVTVRARGAARTLRDARRGDAPRTPRARRRRASRTFVHRVGRRGLFFEISPGDGTRTPLLLLNGIGAPLQLFQPFVDRLDPRIEVIRVDPPGIGRSPGARGPYRFGTLAKMLCRALDDLGYDEVDVLGISWGGGLAQEFARVAGRRCRRVVVVSSGAGYPLSPVSPAGVSQWTDGASRSTRRRRRTAKRRARAGRARLRGRALQRRALGRRRVQRRRRKSVLGMMAGQMYGGQARCSPRAAGHVLAVQMLSVRPIGWSCQMFAGLGWTSAWYLPLLRQRTLVLAGAEDPVVPAFYGRVVSTLARHGELHVYPGGHVDLLVKPEVLLPRIEEFLARR